MKKRYVLLCSCAIVACIVSLCKCSYAHALEVQDDRYVSEASLERRFGRRYLQLKNLPEDPQNGTVLSWNFPTNIVLAGVGYKVVRTTDGGEFEITSPTNSVVFASGTITRMSSARYARVCGCGLMAASNMGVEVRALQTEIRPLDACTNNFYICNVHQRTDREDVLVFHNLFISIQGTNKLDFARVLLNEGLPEGSPKLPQPLP